MEVNEKSKDPVDLPLGKKLQGFDGMIHRGDLDFTKKSLLYRGSNSYSSVVYKLPELTRLPLSCWDLPMFSVLFLDSLNPPLMTRG
jgi:hypothetical protein